jgi:hypothetical protein
MTACFLFLAVLPTLPTGVTSAEVVFGRGHRRDRPSVHAAGHPDSDVVYRVGVNVGLAEGAQVSRIRLVQLPTRVLLDIESVASPQQDVLVVRDDDRRTAPFDYDGDYDLTISLASGESFHQVFTATGMNSATMPQFDEPVDCGVVDADDASFSWAPSRPQQAAPDETYNLHFRLIIHTDPWHSVLESDLAAGTTQFDTSGLAPGPYRDVIIESFSHKDGALTLTRQVWNARGFVVGENEICD